MSQILRLKFQTNYAFPRLVELYNQAHHLAPGDRTANARHFLRWAVAQGYLRETIDRTLATAGRTMKWHCLDCHQNFPGPCDRPPAEGCTHCGSRNCFDCNLG